jgi:23S rRNA (guanosine2251-2'-O)-methyltransferase
VLAVLRAARWPVLQLYVNQSTDELIRLCESLIPEDSVQLIPESSARITRLCGHADHQGLAARMAPFPIANEHELMQCAETALARRRDGGRPPILLVCDKIQDAHNFGAIIRNCDAMAVDAVVVGRFQQAHVTPHVARASSGAVNFVSLFSVNNIADALTQLRSLGFRIAAASEKSGRTVADAQLGGPIALVIGSESTGVAQDILKLADDCIAIPMLGSVGSLNAAVASGILLYEIRRQQAAYTKPPS